MVFVELDDKERFIAAIIIQPISDIEFSFIENNHIMMNIIKICIIIVTALAAVCNKMKVKVVVFRKSKPPFIWYCCIYRIVGLTIVLILRLFKNGYIFANLIVCLIVRIYYSFEEQTATNPNLVEYVISEQNEKTAIDFHHGLYVNLINPIDNIASVYLYSLH